MRSVGNKNDIFNGEATSPPLFKYPLLFRFGFEYRRRLYRLGHCYGVAVDAIHFRRRARRVRVWRAAFLKTTPGRHVRRRGAAAGRKTEKIPRKRTTGGWIFWIRTDGPTRGIELQDDREGNPVGRRVTFGSVSIDLLLFAATVWVQ